jgi:hypothetical protein
MILFQEIDWLKNQLEPLKEGEKATIAHLLSNNFEAYAKILHPFMIINPITKRKEYITWKIIEKNYNLSYSDGLSFDTLNHYFKDKTIPENLHFPQTELPFFQLEMLLQSIKQITKQEILFFTSRGSNLAEITNVNNIIQQENGNYYLRGGYIFDESKSWIIWSDEYRDLSMTLFAGTDKMLAVLTSSSLEVLKCSGETSLL